MKKLHILIPSLVATIGMSFISLTGCGDNKDPEPEPVIKSITIKEEGGKKLPKFLKPEQKIKLEAYDDDGLISNAVFSTTSTNITLSGNEVTANTLGKASITCTAEEHKQATWDFNILIPPEPIVDPVTLDKWDEEKKYLCKDNLTCYNLQDVIIKINFKNDWDPDNTNKRPIVGEFHIINDSLKSYKFKDTETIVTIGGEPLVYGTEADWCWYHDDDIPALIYIKIINQEIVNQLINAQEVVITTKIRINKDEPGPFGFYAI